MAILNFVKPYNPTAKKFEERVNRLIRPSPGRVNGVHQSMHSDVRPPMSSGGFYNRYTIPTNDGVIVAGRATI